jgi:hypothetical protein
VAPQHRGAELEDDVSNFVPPNAPSGERAPVAVLEAESGIVSKPIDADNGLLTTSSVEIWDSGRGDKAPGSSSVRGLSAARAHPCFQR